MAGASFLPSFGIAPKSLNFIFILVGKSTKGKLRFVLKLSGNVKLY